MDVSEKLTIKSISLLVTQKSSNLFRNVDNHFPIDSASYTGLFEMSVGILTTATSFSRCNPMCFLSMGLRQGSGLCSSSSGKYPGTEGTNQNRH